MPRGEHKVGCNQSSRTCASPQPSTLAAKANDAACRYLVSADDPATDYSERWLVAAEGKGSEARNETVHARVTRTYAVHMGVTGENKRLSGVAVRRAALARVAR